MIETGTRGRRTRGSLGGGGGAKKSGSRAKAVEISDDDTADDDEDESDFEASAKKSRGKRAVSDSEGAKTTGRLAGRASNRPWRASLPIQQ